MPGCIILSLKARLKKTKRDPCVLQMQNCKTKQPVSVKRNWLLFCSCLCFFIIQIKRNAYGGERGGSGVPVLYVLYFTAGLALFLFGMHQMTKSLSALSNSRLQKKLSALTKSKIRGVLSGVCMTALMQSSSAVTVMLVGLVNAGILTLYETIGVIMGANIGTTATAWLISIAGLAGTPLSAWLNLVTLAGASLLFAAIFCMKKKLQIAAALCGFSMLILGMHFMSDALSPLRAFPLTAQFLLYFSNPLYGLFAGTAITALLQSSSASVGILQALSLTGSVTLASAIPIVLGQNIGTCVTALLACIGTGKNAKRTAFVHLYFNMVGALFLLAVFYGLDAVFSFSFLEKAASPTDIAMVHTAFNLLCTILLYPFSGWLVHLAHRTVR